MPLERDNSNWKAFLKVAGSDFALKEVGTPGAKLDLIV
jgi:hypothetical protein